MFLNSTEIALSCDQGDLNSAAPVNTADIALCPLIGDECVLEIRKDGSL
jgi:hypothetical protein